MRILNALVIFMLVMSSVSTAFAEEGQEAEIKAAVEAAEKWLALVDAKEYDRSWNAAAEMFRLAVPGDQWASTLTAIRRPMGNVISRKVQKAEFKTQLPGAPDGQYVVIQFKTSFSGKEEAVETVTPKLEKDGVWRVSGYYIR